MNEICEIGGGLVGKFVDLTGHIFGQLTVGEEQICKILDDNKINYLYNKGYFKDLLGIDGLPLRYDFILLQNGNKPYRLIEFDGPQHDLPVKYFGGEEKFLKQKDNDRRKNVYAQSHNILLVHIPYSKRDTMTLNDLIEDKYFLKEKCNYGY